MKVLDRITKPDDIKKLDLKELETLAEEIRDFLINNVAKSGGHLASNLGIVELTIALLYHFDFLKDKIIFDVGHQSYVYKILTGRKEEFSTLRTKGGLSGFPKREESIYDFFDTGHSSNSISVALGMARARDLQKDKYQIISLIGDGAFTGGMVYEALNDLGFNNSRMLIILNDNGMSISKNVGGLSVYLNKMRLTRSYNKLKAKVRSKKSNIFIKAGRRIKNSVKNLFYRPLFFESLGIRYIGPIDGHNIKELIDILDKLENINEPVVLHVVTRKGEGYKPAMESPSLFHAVGSFKVESGEILKKNELTYSKAFGEALCELAKEDEKIVAISAAMLEGVHLSDFAKKFPNRIFDVGITEEHATSLAAGLASNGIKPVFAVYSTFLQRAYDQIIIDVCMQNMPVVFAIDRAGVVGSDGKTHQGVFDIAYLKSIPNMTIIAPKSVLEMPYLLKYAFAKKRPVAIRYPRGADTVLLDPLVDIKEGVWEEVISGSNLVVIATGKMVQNAYLAISKMKEKPILVNALFIKPLDEVFLKKVVKENLNVLTIEDHNLVGGFGESVLVTLQRLGFKGKIKMLGYPDVFIHHSTVNELYKEFKLDEESIKKEIKKLM